MIRQNCTRLWTAACPGDRYVRPEAVARSLRACGSAHRRRGQFGAVFGKHVPQWQIQDRSHNRFADLKQRGLAPGRIGLIGRGIEPMDTPC
jgi:hypothetical protein